MIRGVIFDIDGVVLDSMSIWQDLGKRYVLGLGKVPEDNLNEILFSMSMEQGALYLKNTYEIDKDPEVIVEEIGKLIEAYYFYETEAKAGIRDLVKYLKEQGIPMVAATSSMREHVNRALVRNGLDSYMTEILTTGEIGTSKHEPLVYQMAAEKMGSKPEETLVLEDSLYALKTAKKAGFIPVGVFDAYGEERQEELNQISACYVHNLKEVIPFVESMKGENL